MSYKIYSVKKSKKQKQHKHINKHLVPTNLLLYGATKAAVMRKFIKVGCARSNVSAIPLEPRNQDIFFDFEKLFQRFDLQYVSNETA